MKITAEWRQRFGLVIARYLAGMPPANEWQQGVFAVFDTPEGQAILERIDRLAAGVTMELPDEFRVEDWS